MKLLFVCTDNTCRSPMAQAIFDRLSEQRHLDVTCDSAGLAACENECVNPRCVDVMNEIGLDISGHRSKNITPKLLLESDYIVVMTDEQKERLCAFDPSLCEKIRVLDVDDPNGRPIEIYRMCRNQIKDHISRIAEI